MNFPTKLKSNFEHTFQISVQKSKHVFENKLKHNFSGKHPEYIACETTTVRLVSSGAFDNSVTVTFTRLTDNDINTYMSLVCLPDDMSLQMRK